MKEELEVSEIIAKIVKLSDDKKITIEYETYGACCTAVPTYLMTVLKNGEKVSSKAMEIENGLESLLKKINRDSGEVYV